MAKDKRYLEDFIADVYAWLQSAKTEFDDTALTAIKAKIPDLDEYKKSIELIEKLQEFLASDIDKTDFITSLIEEYKARLQKARAFIESKREQYEIQKEIYLKYNGTLVGYDPFYNFKNKTHSSYQIHPYLYNFVEKSNVAYPLANTFFVAFSERYEAELVEKGLDDMIGKHGNVINLSKHGMFDWTGYQSQYEKDFSQEASENPESIPPQFGYAGAFYPPALEEFLDDPQTFIQNVQDNLSTSYYYRLGLSQNELNKIAEQLRVYEKPIREIVQAQKTKPDGGNTLSNEYDIYKYTQDVYGNSLILFKSYKQLYQKHEGEDGYVPSYNEKKNMPGELWMRIKNHPIAFPAFDLRDDYVDIAQYCRSDTLADEYKLNGYIENLNDYFSTESDFKNSAGEEWSDIFERTRDAIQRTYTSSKHHMRCFFDMELSPDKQSLLLTVPCQTGTNHTVKQLEQNEDTFVYSNVNIIVGYLYQDYNYTEDYNYYTFSSVVIKDNVENVTNNIDNLKPSINLLNTSNYKSLSKINEFVGFAKYSNYIVAIYVQKYWYSAGDFHKCFTEPGGRNKKPHLKLECIGYNGANTFTRKLDYTLKYDILYKPTDPKTKLATDDYKYANVMVVTSTEKTITLGYISEEFQTIVSKGTRGKAYTADSTIVNFAEYTKTVEDRTDLSVHGENKKYPSDTALLQTTDAQHINIYNSFDSFTSYLVNIDLRFVGSKVSVKAERIYNLNTDIGYYPLFADKHGKSRFYVNSALSGAQTLNLELLGPENSDVDYTPVILDTDVTDKYGRVTEDYRDYNKLTAFSEEIQFEAGNECAVYTFQLSDIFVDDLGRSTYEDLAETGDLLDYKWNLANTSYTSTPVARGTLRSQNPSDYYYVSSSKYDLLSGQEIFGPNGTSYQGLQNTNHIDNISAINIEVLYDDDNIPTAVQMSCILDGRVDPSAELIIPESKFQLLVYVKNTLNSYQYYRIIENANHNIAEKMYKYEDAEIKFQEISSLSDFTINGKQPFKSIKELNKDLKTFNPATQVSSYGQMSAMLEFKYSEENTVDREFPILASSETEDDVIFMSNEDQYIYFFALDNFDTVSKDIFYMEKYDNSFDEPMYRKIKVNTISRKYQDFYDKALTIEATYNVEKLNDDDKETEYGIVLYFNYKNYTSPSYVEFKKRYTVDGKADVPQYSMCQSTSKSLDNTYLRLAPGKSGQLDIRIDYVEYAKINKTDIGQSVVGKETRVLKSYYIMNVSDDKPKFIISRSPFKAEN